MNQFPKSRTGSGTCQPKQSSPSSLGRYYHAISQIKQLRPRGIPELASRFLASEHQGSGLKGPGVRLVLLEETYMTPRRSQQNNMRILLEARHRVPCPLLNFHSTLGDSTHRCLLTTRILGVRGWAHGRGVAGSTHAAPSTLPLQHKPERLESCRELTRLEERVE